jgi:hypothetical protein
MFVGKIMSLSKFTLLLNSNNLSVNIVTLLCKLYRIFMEYFVNNYKMPYLTKTVNKTVSKSVIKFFIVLS